MAIKFNRLLVIRFKDILEFAALYLAFFSLNGVLIMAESEPIGAGLLKIFLEDISDYRIIVLLISSLLVVLKHMQILQSGRREYKARLVSGASINEVPALYFAWTLFLASITAVFAVYIFSYFVSTVRGMVFAWVLVVCFGICAASTMRVSYV